ncbi:quinate dehydrogenase [Purpureocillium lavendulum]|uniref:Quinate dehydrogenase n=1 Tax=Purpureocillium lavendulum TaxID=1247861 RepID=A0AB34G0X5_9HYPO|nr:quinate dehydrogenase [Purpureocillium lavendulum]
MIGQATAATPGPDGLPLTASMDLAPPGGAKGGGSRVSLACLPCRSRHVRCDAAQPVCDRCAAEGRECRYTKSRRGGLDRAALAARRTRVEQAAAVAVAAAGNPLPGPNPNPTTKPCFDALPAPAPALAAPAPPQHHQLPDMGRLFTPPDEPQSAGRSPASQGQPISVANDALIHLYYKCFHRFHPCVLPRKRLEHYWRNASSPPGLKPLIFVMRFIGAIFCVSEPVVSPPSEQQVEAILTETSTASDDYFMAQSHLLFSIVLYWRGKPQRSRLHMDRVVDMAFASGMFSRDFAMRHGANDAVLAESLRRTWWQIYIVDAYYAAIKRSGTFRANTVEPTADLPCEEEDYELEVGVSMPPFDSLYHVEMFILTLFQNIPQPKTLEEFNAREFAPDDSAFSSFAHLIGGVQGMTSAMTRANSIANPSPSLLGTSSLKVLEIADAVIDGWMLLLPEAKRNPLSADGEVDELIFQALMAVYATTVGVHRPFSRCSFDLLENISGCSTVPNDQGSGKPPSDLQAVHTAKCINAAEAQIRLLALPASSSRHSPFTVCMLTTGTLSLLAACKFILQNQKLAIARDQIRLSIGYHKAMAGVWTKAAKNVEEVQAIAREVLMLSPGRSRVDATPKATHDMADIVNQMPNAQHVSNTDANGQTNFSAELLDSTTGLWDSGDGLFDLSCQWWMFPTETE